jgi:hypothetical protein
MNGHSAPFCRGAVVQDVPSVLSHLLFLGKSSRSAKFSALYGINLQAKPKRHILFCRIVQMLIESLPLCICGTVCGA